MPLKSEPPVQQVDIEEVELLENNEPSTELKNDYDIDEKRFSGDKRSFDQLDEGLIEELPIQTNVNKREIKKLQKFNEHRVIIFDNLKNDKEKLDKIIAQFNTDNNEIFNDYPEDRMHSQFEKELGEKDISSLVVCIFAKFSDNSDSGKAFICKYNKEICVKYFSKYFNAESKIPIYFIINDNKKVDTDQNQFHFFYQHSNIYVSLNTYSESWYIERICRNMSKLNNSVCNGDKCEPLENIIDDVFENLPPQNIQNKPLIKNIYSVLTNTYNQIPHNLPEYINESYDLNKVHEDNGMCFVLDFMLDIEGDNFVKRKETDQDVKYFEETFHGLVFNVHSYKEFKLKNFIKTMSVIELSSNSCIIICLITCYEDGNIYYKYNNKMFKLKNIFKWFNKSWDSVPKILIIHDGYENKNKPNETLPDLLDISKHISKAPKDFMVIYSSIINAKNKNNENSNKDLSYLKHFCKIIQRYYRSHDMVTMAQITTMIIKQQFNASETLFSSYPVVLVKSRLDKLYVLKKDLEKWPPTKQIVSVFRHLTLTLPNIKRKPLPLEDMNKLFFKTNNGRCLFLSYYCNNQEKESTNEHIEKLENSFRELGVKSDKLYNCSISEWNIFEKESMTYHEKLDFIIVVIFSNGHPDAPTEKGKLFKYLTAIDAFEKPKLCFVLDSRKPETETSDSDDGEEVIDMTSTRESINIDNTLSLTKYCNFLYFYSDEIPKTVDILKSEIQNHSSHHDLNVTLSNVMKSIKYHSQYDEDEHLCFIDSTLAQLVSFNKNTITESSSIEINPIETNPKGMCLILNNVNYANDHESKRNGSKFDVQELENFFAQKLNFEIIIKTDMETPDITYLFTEIDNADYSSYSSFVFCCLSHGSDNGVIKCVDGEEINIDDIVETLERNRTLKNKPKILLIEACQGPIEFDIQRIEPPEISKDGKNTQTKFFTKKFNVNYPDFFIFASSYPGFASFMNNSEGSYFIQSLCKILKANFEKYDLATMATLVCKDVAFYNKPGNSNKQVPFVSTTMTKQIDFLPYKQESYNENTDTIQLSN